MGIICQTGMYHLALTLINFPQVFVISPNRPVFLLPYNLDSFTMKVTFIHACHRNLISVSLFFVIVYFLNVFHTSNLQVGGNIFCWLVLFQNSLFAHIFFLYNKNGIKLEKYVSCIIFLYSRQDHSIIINVKMQKILIHVIHEASGPKKMLNKNAQY